MKRGFSWCDFLIFNFTYLWRTSSRSMSSYSIIYKGYNLSLSRFRCHNTIPHASTLNESTLSLGPLLCLVVPMASALNACYSLLKPIQHHDRKAPPCTQIKVPMTRSCSVGIVGQSRWGLFCHTAFFTNLHWLLRGTIYRDARTLEFTVWTTARYKMRNREVQS